MLFGTTGEGVRFSHTLSLIRDKKTLHAMSSSRADFFLGLNILSYCPGWEYLYLNPKAGWNSWYPLSILLVSLTNWYHGLRSRAISLQFKTDIARESRAISVLNCSDITKWWSMMEIQIKQWQCKSNLTCLFANYDPGVMPYNSFDRFPKSAKSLTAI